MADFTIRSSQKDTSLFGWLKIRYTDEYNDAWCKDHDVKKVKSCWNDIEYAIAVCRGVHNITDGSKEMRDVFSMTRKEKKEELRGWCD